MCAFVGRAKQKQVALFEVQPDQTAVEALAQKPAAQFKQLGHVQTRFGNGGFDHVAQRLMPVLGNGETVGNGFEEKPACLCIGHLMEVFQQSNDHHVLFMPLQAFVDLAARSKKLHTQLGESLGLHLLSLSRHALELIDEFIKTCQAVIHQRLGELVSHVPRGMRTAKRDALLPASSGKKGKQLDECFEDACGHDLRAPSHSTQVAARKLP